MLVDSLPSRGVTSKLEVKVLVTPHSFAFALSDRGGKRAFQSLFFILDAAIGICFVDLILVTIGLYQHLGPDLSSVYCYCSLR